MRDSFIGQEDLLDFLNRRVLLSANELHLCGETVALLNGALGTWKALHPGSAPQRFLLSGPCAKGIAPRTTQAIDVALYLDPRRAPETRDDIHAWLLDLLRGVLPDAKPDGPQPPPPAVRLSLPGFSWGVLLTPVFPDGAADGGGFQFAKETGERVRTSIPWRVQFTRRRNEVSGGGLARAYGLADWWLARLRTEDPRIRFKSYLVELICAHLVDEGHEMSDGAGAFECFLQYVADTGLQKRIAFFDHYRPEDLLPPTGAPIEIFDPVNPRNNVAVAYTLEERRLFVSAARKGLEILKQGRETPDRTEALRAWRDLLGSDFPADDSG